MPMQYWEPTYVPTPDYRRTPNPAPPVRQQPMTYVQPAPKPKPQTRPAHPEPLAQPRVEHAQVNVPAPGDLGIELVDEPLVVPTPDQLGIILK